MPDPAAPAPAPAPSLEEVRRQKELQALALDGVRRLVALLRTLATYPVGHVHVGRATDQWQVILQKLHAWKAPLSISLEGGRLLVEGVEVDPADAAVEKLRDMMWKRSIRAVVLEKGIATSDLHALSEVLAMEARALSAAGGPRSVLKEKGARAIKLVEFFYRLRRGAREPVAAEEGSPYSLAEAAAAGEENLERFSGLLEDGEVKDLLKDVAGREGIAADSEDIVDIIPLLLDYVRERMEEQGIDDPAQAVRILKETLATLRDNLDQGRGGTPLPSPSAPALPAALVLPEGPSPDDPRSLLVGDIEIRGREDLQGSAFASFLQRYHAVRDAEAQQRILNAVAGMEGVSAHLTHLREVMERNDHREEFITVLFTIFRDERNPRQAEFFLKRALTAVGAVLDQGDRVLGRQCLGALLEIPFPEPKAEVLRKGLSELGIDRLLMAYLEPTLPEEEEEEEKFLRSLVAVAGEPALRFLIELYPLDPDPRKIERIRRILLAHGPRTLGQIEPILLSGGRLQGERLDRIFRLVSSIGGAGSVACFGLLLPMLGPDQLGEAYRMLASIGAEEGVTILLKGLEREGRKLRLQILPLLAGFDRAEVVNTLVEIASTRDLLRRNYDERILAIQTLEKIGSPAALPALDRLAGGRSLFSLAEDRRVQTWAAFAAAKIRDAVRARPQTAPA